MSQDQDEISHIIKREVVCLKDDAEEEEEEPQDPTPTIPTRALPVVPSRESTATYKFMYGILFSGGRPRVNLSRSRLEKAYRGKVDLDLVVRRAFETARGNWGFPVCDGEPEQELILLLQYVDHYYGVNKFDTFLNKIREVDISDDPISFR